MANNQTFCAVMQDTTKNTMHRLFLKDKSFYITIRWNPVDQFEWAIYYMKLGKGLGFGEDQPESLKPFVRKG